MEAIILAGGLGTRLRTTLPNTPKPMAPIRGVPFLEHQLKYWIAQGVNHFILSVGYKNEQIRDYFKDNYRNIPLHYAIENSPLGTGGAINYSKKYLKRQDKDFLILNGDTHLEISLKKLKNIHMQKKSLLTLSLIEVLDNHRYGMVELDEYARVTQFNCSQNFHNPQWINGGVYLAAPSLFEKTPLSACSFEREILPELLVTNRVFGYTSEANFIDIGTPDDYRRAQNVIPT